MRLAPPAVPDFRAAAARPHAVLRLAFLCIALTAGQPARAWQLDETRTDFRLSVLNDVTVGAGSVLVAARYGGAWGVRAGSFVRDVHVVPSAPNVMLGANYVWTYSRWRGGFGAVWFDKENANNGTRWNFDFTVSFDVTDRIYAEYQHNSHGSTIGIKTDRSNEGWNLLGIGFVF